MIARPKVWMQFGLVFVVICALIALSRVLRDVDFALALLIKGFFILSSIVLLWRMWRGDPSWVANGSLSVFPPRMRAWMLGETDDKKNP
jgi:hypothetical protein